jgi:hypothetical protein
MTPTSIHNEPDPRYAHLLMPHTCRCKTGRGVTVQSSIRGKSIMRSRTADKTAEEKNPLKKTGGLSPAKSFTSNSFFNSLIIVCTRSGR